jgi:hypothetical protein
MIPLHKIASSQFLLLHAEQPADEVRQLLTQLRSNHVVIRRREGSPRYFLCEIRELRELLGRAAGDQLLLDLLGAIKDKAVDVVDADSDAETSPDRCVVIEAGHIIGFYDASVPPAMMTRRGNGSAWEESAPPVARAVQADFPGNVPQGRTVSLLVSLAFQGGTRPSIPVAAPAGTEVDIVVQPQRGFDLVGPGDGRLVITNEEETLPLQFKLRASEIGPGRVRILAFQNGQPLGAVTLTPTVLAADAVSGGGRVGETQVLAPLVAAQPDLSLVILEQADQGKTALTMLLTAADSSLELSLKRFGPIVLQVDPLGYFREFFKDIEQLPLKTAEDREAASVRLGQKGGGLFQTLLPSDLQALLWSLRDRIGTVQVLSDEPWIPWELLRLQGRENGRVIEGPFLCEAFAMTRWFPGIGRRPRLGLKHLALVVPGDSGLAHAQEERSYLLKLQGEHHMVTEVKPTTYMQVMKALKAGVYDGWHFTGHGRFDASDPEGSPLLLEGRKLSLTPEDICGEAANCGLARPLVFLNACQTGQEAMSLTGIGGWAKSFISAGASAFLGTLWSVFDDSAHRFATAFYDALLGGEPVGKAVKTARAAIRPRNDLTWLAYTAFADPLATLSG